MSSHSCKSLYGSLKKKGISIPKDLRKIIYCNTLLLEEDNIRFVTEMSNILQKDYVLFEHLLSSVKEEYYDRLKHIILNAYLCRSRYSIKYMPGYDPIVTGDNFDTDYLFSKEESISEYMSDLYSKDRGLCIDILKMYHQMVIYSIEKNHLLTFKHLYGIYDFVEKKTMEKAINKEKETGKETEEESIETSLSIDKDSEDSEGEIAMDEEEMDREMDRDMDMDMEIEEWENGEWTEIQDYIDQIIIYDRDRFIDIISDSPYSLGQCTIHDIEDWEDRIIEGSIGKKLILSMIRLISIVLTRIYNSSVEIVKKFMKRRGYLLIKYLDENYGDHSIISLYTHHIKKMTE